MENPQLQIFPIEEEETVRMTLDTVADATEESRSSVSISQSPQESSIIQPIQQFLDSKLPPTKDRVTVLKLRGAYKAPGSSAKSKKKSSTKHGGHAAATPDQSDAKVAAPSQPFFS